MTEFLPLQYDPYLPDAVIVDIDGTLAHRVDRGPYEYDKVHQDQPDDVISMLVEEAAHRGDTIIVVSGREDFCRDETRDWLLKHCIPFDLIYMRRMGDVRKDSIVKSEIFDKHINGTYNVRYVLDDRDQVVEMWRARGLKCLQVAEGNF